MDRSYGRPGVANQDMDRYLGRPNSARRVLTQETTNGGVLIRNRSCHDARSVAGGATKQNAHRFHGRRERAASLVGQAVRRLFFLIGLGKSGLALAFSRE